MSDFRSKRLIEEEKRLKNLESSLRNLRVADVELFVTAAKVKSLSSAAKTHHLSQSAASAAIMRVEAAFKAELCMHERRQFRLTREGHVMLPKLENIIEEVRSLIAHDDEPVIHIAMTHAIAQVAVPSLLSMNKLCFHHMRPDDAYKAILEEKVDIALVLDNSNWKGVQAVEISRGAFQLYSRQRDIQQKPVLLPEDQQEVLFFKQEWMHKHGYSLPVKSRIPSWSLIAQICHDTDEVGFLPAFLAKKYNLYPVEWQMTSPPYRLLVLFKSNSPRHKHRVEEVLNMLTSLFN